MCQIQIPMHSTATPKTKLVYKMNIRPKNEFDKDGRLLPTSTLIKLLLNKSSQLMQPNPLSLDPVQTINIRAFESSQIETASQVSFDQYLQQCAIEAKWIDINGRNRLVQGHLKLEVKECNRKKFIMVFSGASREMMTNPNYYRLVVSEIPQYPNNLFNQIDKDLTRTYKPNSEHFSKLSNVLKAYAIRNPRLTYCQGMNYLVGFFLERQYTEQQAFWLVTQLIQDCLPPDYFVDMGSVTSLSSIIMQLLVQAMPGFNEMCHGLGLETSSFLVTWLVCLFTKGLSPQLSGFIMQNIVIEREVALVKAAMALLKLAVPRMAECEDYQCFVRGLEAEVMKIGVREFKWVYDSMYVNRYFFGVLLRRYMKEYEKGSKDMNNKMKYLPVCLSDLPICLHYLEINRRLSISQVTTLRIKPNLDSLLDPSYLTSVANPTQPICQPNPASKSSLDHLLLGRHSHICIEHDLRKKVSQYQANDEDFKQEESTGSELDQFQERALRKSANVIVSEMTSEFEVLEDYRTEEFDVLEDVEERRGRGTARKGENPESAGKKTMFGWIRRLF